MSEGFSVKDSKQNKQQTKPGPFSTITLQSPSQPKEQLDASLPSLTGSQFEKRWLCLFVFLDLSLNLIRQGGEEPCLLGKVDVSSNKPDRSQAPADSCFFSTRRVDYFFFSFLERATELLYADTNFVF